MKLFVTKFLLDMTNCTSLTDHELLWLMNQDSANAFKEIYYRNWKNLYHQSYQRLKSAAAAEEIVQDVFMTLWQKRKSLEIVSLPNYLSAMCRHAVYHYMAKELKTISPKYPDEVGYVTASAANASLDNKMTLDLVKKLSNNLPEKCRQVFIYNKIDDQSLPEVARKLNISIKTAEAHLTKALRIIRMSVRF